MMMIWVEFVKRVTELLAAHAKSIVLVMALFLIGVIAHGFGLIEATPDSAIGTFIWLYFIVTMISLGLIAWVLFLMCRASK